MINYALFICASGFTCLLQMELKLRLMELNWQKSQCVKIIAADERTKSEVRVWNQSLFTLFCCDLYLFTGQACSARLVLQSFNTTFSNFPVLPYFLCLVKCNFVNQLDLIIH